MKSPKTLERRLLEWGAVIVALVGVTGAAVAVLRNVKEATDIGGEIVHRASAETAPVPTASAPASSAPTSSAPTSSAPPDSRHLRQEFARRLQSQIDYAKKSWPDLAQAPHDRQSITSWFDLIEADLHKYASIRSNDDQLDAEFRGYRDRLGNLLPAQNDDAGRYEIVTKALKSLENAVLTYRD